MTARQLTVAYTAGAITLFALAALAGVAAGRLLDTAAGL